MSLSEIGSWASIISIPLAILIAFWSGKVYTYITKTSRESNQTQKNKKGNAIQIEGKLEDSQITQSNSDEPRPKK